MTPPEEAVRRPLATDVRALIGILAVLEGQLLGESNSDALPPWATRLAGRLERDGLVAAPAGNRALRQALNDLNHRLRYVVGERDDPPESRPVG